MTKSNRNLVVIAALGVLIVVVAVWYSFFSKVTAPDFSQYPAGSERKAAFFDYFEPIVADINAQIADDRARVEDACSSENPAEVALPELANKYRVDESDLKQSTLCDLLLRRADTVPASLALAQAANESAWGTSRFAQQGNNFFGQWCFTKGCGIVPRSRDENKTHEVADFRSPADSVESYMLNINGHDAYKPLRDIRESLREEEIKITGLQLSWGLDNYSERGEEYGKELRDMINFNKLTQYDDETP